MSADEPCLEPEVCIIGAGPHGLAAALHLGRADRAITGIDLDPGSTAYLPRAAQWPSPFDSE